MRLWLRVRRARSCVITIIAVAIVLVISGDFTLPLPNLLGGPRLAVPLALLLPLAIGIAVAWGFTTGDPLVEAVASRPLRLLDVLYAVSASSITVIICSFIYVLGGTEFALAAGRNALGYVGLMLIGRRVLSPVAAALLPVGFAIITSLFGTDATRLPHWWAWPLAIVNDVEAWCIAVGLLFVGAIVTINTQLIQND